MTKEEIDKRIMKYYSQRIEQEIAYNPSAISDKEKELQLEKEKLIAKIYKSKDRTEQEKLLPQIMNLIQACENENIRETWERIRKSEIRWYENILKEAIKRVNNGERKEKVFNEIASQMKEHLYGGKIASDVGGLKETYLQKLSQRLNFKNSVK